jgi:multiple sugar transport system substrate-binding protein
VIFLKWLTEPEENLRYLEGVGYMPVTKAAMETAREVWGKDADGIEKSYVDMLKTMNSEYMFLTQKPLEKYAELEIFYEGRLRKISASAREKYLENLLYGHETAWRMATESAYEEFIE